MKSLTACLGPLVLCAGAIASPQPPWSLVQASGVDAAAAKPAKPGARPAAELARPFAIPEAERVCPSPYSPGVTIDTPLSVNGVPIPASEVKRHLCLGFGLAYVEFEKFQLIIQSELARRREAGDDMAQYEISEAAVDKFIETQRVDFAQRYPTLDFQVEVGRAYISYDLYRDPARQSLQFDRLFLPDNPREWPELTRELIRAWGGDAFLLDAEQSYDRRLQRQLEDGLEELPPDDPIIVGTWKDTVLRGLSDFSILEYLPARLPEGVLMSVDGQPILIETVWRKIGPHVSAFELDKARRLLVLSELMEQDLASKDALMSQEEFEKAWPEGGRTYRQTIDMYAMLANQMIGMSSVQGYARYARLLKSLERLLADEIADLEKLKPYIAACNQITGIAKANAEFILSSAWDGDLVQWKQDGWADARARSLELKKQLDQGADWKTLRELHSEFWDPPLPEVGQKPPFGLRFKGAFGEQTRNQLLSMLEESEAFNLLYGFTVGDRTFFEQKPGTIAGPFMGPRGYYIVRLMGKTPPQRPLDMNEVTHRQLVEDYYLRFEFNRRAQELLLAALEKGAVEGP